MAEKPEDQTNGCTFQWEIENISHCWLKQKEILESSTFTADALKGTNWSLMLFPMGNVDKNCISLYLKREYCNGPHVIEVNFQLAFLGKDGSILKEKSFSTERIRKTRYRGYLNERRERVFIIERETFLAEDTMRVQCRIWSGKDEIPVKPKLIYRRSIFTINQRYFVFKIDKISTLKSGMRKKFKDSSIDVDFILSEGFDRLDIDVISFDYKIKYISCSTRVLDSEGKKENFGIKNYSFSDLKKGILSPTLLCPRSLMDNKGRYLQNDVLYLEFVFSTGEYFNSGEILNLKNESNVLTNVGKDNSEMTAVLIEDLKTMYNDGIFSDAEIRTSAKSFPVRKNILSARSAVFRNMFSYEMKEKTSGYVDITDLEEDTVHRMLLYIYTDSLEDLRLESASKLYAAADKYEILALRSRCSSFIKNNLCPTKVCNILALADLHQDNDLKSFVENYILEQDKEVFGCAEWKDFMNTNLKLAADIMYRKLLPVKI